MVASSLDAEFEVHLVARGDTTLCADPDFTLTLHGTTNAVDVPIVPASFSRAYTMGELCTSAQGALESEHLLLTTAVTTPGVPVVAPLLVEIARRRARRPGTTTFIAAENDPGPTYPDLCDVLQGEGVECRRTMVNRLCYQAPGEASPAHRSVHADQLAEWVIQGAPTTPALASLAQLPYVSFVADVAPLEMRKRWLVNGGHLALALMGWNRGYTLLDLAAAEPGRTQWLSRLLADIDAAVRRVHPDLDHNSDYAHQHVAAWARHPLGTDRVLRRLRRADIGPLLTDLERKLGEPIQAHVDCEHAISPEMNDVLATLHRMLLEETKYIDWGDIRKRVVPLQATLDDHCVERYRLWLARIVGDEVATSRAGELSRAFERHRDLVVTW